MCSEPGCGAETQYGTNQVQDVSNRGKHAWAWLVSKLLSYATFLHFHRVSALMRAGGVIYQVNNQDVTGSAPDLHAQPTQQVRTAA